MRSSREIAISQAIQSWLLNSEPTPVAKQLAQELNYIDTQTEADIIRLVLRKPSLSIESLNLYHFISMLSDAVDMALDGMASPQREADHAV